MKVKVDWFMIGLAAAAGMAWIAPNPGAQGGWLHPELLTKLGVALIFFLHGLTLSSASLREGTMRWPLHLVVQTATFGLFPLLGIAAMTVMAPLGPDLRTGIFYLAALPSTVSSSVALTAAARGNVPAAVFNATLSSLLGVFLTPLWLGLVIGATGSPLPLGHVMWDLVRWLVFPLALGQLMRPLLAKLAQRHKKRIQVVDRLTILMLVYTSFCDSVKGGVWVGHGASAVLATLAASVVLLTIVLIATSAMSHALGFSTEDRIAAVFCGSKKTLASGVPMARLIFSSHPGLSIILLPIMIYHPLQLVVCGWLAGRFARREEPSPAHAAEPSP